jgi:hypothetical protein
MVPCDLVREIVPREVLCAAFAGTGTGGRMEEVTSRSGYVRQDRPLQIRGFEIDVEGEGWVLIERVLETYLCEVEAFIEAFLLRQAVL